jgi:hypothetical protein
VTKKEAENILKYKDLITEIQHIWNAKTKVTPVTVGATGTISKSFRKYLSSVQESTISRNYRKQLYWAQHTYCSKC